MKFSGISYLFILLFIIILFIVSTSEESHISLPFPFSWLFKEKSNKTPAKMSHKSKQKKKVHHRKGNKKFVKKGRGKKKKKKKKVVKIQMVTRLKCKKVCFRTHKKCKGKPKTIQICKKKIKNCPKFAWKRCWLSKLCIPKKCRLVNKCKFKKFKVCKKLRPRVKCIPHPQRKCFKVNKHAPRCWKKKRKICKIGKGKKCIKKLIKVCFFKVKKFCRKIKKSRISEEAHF